MIRLRVVYDKVIYAPVSYLLADFSEVFLFESFVNRVDQCNFLIDNQIRVITYTKG